jgi:hypothetical protein
MRRIAMLALAATVVAACGIGDPGAPSSSGAAASPTPEEAQLLAGVRLDLQNSCTPLRTGISTKALATIECRPTSDLASRVAVSLFNTQDDLVAAYLAKLTEHQVQPRTNGGSCLPDQPSEGAYTPGDEGPDLMPVRGACFFDANGDAHDLATLPPYVLIDVDGSNAESAERFAWLGNQDTPGSPTVWSGTGPMSPEK